MITITATITIRENDTPLVGDRVCATGSGVAGMNGINYEDLELRALAHMAYQCGPRMKSVFVDSDAVREMSRRHWAYDNSPRVKPSQAADAHGSFSRKLMGEAGPGIHDRDVVFISL